MVSKFCQYWRLPPPTIRNLRASNSSQNSNVEDLGISFPIFPSRTNLKLHNISVTPKWIKMVITNLDSSKASGSSNSSKKELTWVFIHSSSTVQFLFKGILCPRVLKGHICGICIKQYWGKVYG